MRLARRPSKRVCHSTRDYHRYVADPLNLSKCFGEGRAGRSRTGRRYGRGEEGPRHAGLHPVSVRQATGSGPGEQYSTVTPAMLTLLTDGGCTSTPTAEGP
jgi:hypothetical protein